MPTNLENSAVATGLEKVSFHSNPKETKSEVTQSCPTLFDPMDYSLPGSSLHGILKARVLEWGAICLHRRILIIALQENQRYQGNTSRKDGLDKGQKWYGLNRSRRYQEEVATIHRRTIQKRSSWPRSSRWCDYSARARHPGTQSQVGLRKHHYEQS